MPAARTLVSTIGESPGELVGALDQLASAFPEQKITPELVARDPENRLLARGPRLRLQAEFIRDQALAVSGLLNDEIGGHSVSPYQPAGLWEELAYRQDGKSEQKDGLAAPPSGPFPG